MFWLGGRGSVLAIAVSFIILFITIKYHHHTAPRFWSTLMASFLVGIGLAEIFAVYEWNGLISSFSTNNSTLNSFSSGRIELWQWAWGNIKEQYIWGYGTEGHIILSSMFLEPDGYKVPYVFHPHNIVLQFLVEWGVIGASLAFSWLFLAFKKGFLNYVTSPSVPLPLTVIAAGLIIITQSAHAMVSGPFFFSQSLLYIAIAFAIWTQPRTTWHER